MKHLVEPIRDKKQIKAVENYLAQALPKNLLLTMKIQTQFITHTSTV